MQINKTCQKNPPAPPLKGETTNSQNKFPLTFMKNQPKSLMKSYDKSVKLYENKKKVNKK